MTRLKTIVSAAFSTVSKRLKPNVIFVLGGPGSGKGTISALVAQKYPALHHLSAGELLRAERQRPGSQFGELIEARIQSGNIVPVAITCQLLENAMKESSKDSFIIDGFPRNEDNLTGWTRQMGDKANVRSVLFLECPDKICIERCLERGKTGGRSDDNEETLLKRIKTHYEASMPVVHHYEKQNLVKKIDASKPLDNVFSQVEAVLKSLNIK